MKNYPIKAHFSIMKQTAIQDYETVKQWCLNNDYSTTEPKGHSWKQIEDATADMLHVLSDFKPYLNRGLSYYNSLLKAKQLR